ncbi:MAG: hypothetical protein IJI43_03480 [Bacilli bacterium]|nr:hypothetical protein [Bacilli bacterium]
MIKAIKERYQKIKYKKEKKRFLAMSSIFAVSVILIVYFLITAYGSYITESRLKSNVDRAVYVLDEQMMTFNIDSAKIVPSNSPFTYSFSVSNFNSDEQSEVDLQYKLKVRTTTNLPITLRMYRNEEYDDTGATNILGSPTLRQDEDGAWYKVYDETNYFTMNYANQVTDVYQLVVDFPLSYANDTTYADVTENISIIIESKQII